MQHIVLVALGGALGATARYLLSGVAVRALGPSIPWGIFTANVLGSFLLGLLVGALALRQETGQEWRLFLGTGVLGGFTTFSTFAVDTVEMLERKAYAQAATYSLGTLMISIVAVFLGLMIARKVFAG